QSRIKKHQFKALPATLPAQQGIDAKQKLEHRATAHRRRLIRVTGKTNGNGAAWHRRQPVADRLAGLNAFTGGKHMLNARQPFQKAATTGDNQTIVGNIPGVGMYRAAIGADALYGGGMVLYALAAEEIQ